VTTFTVLTVFHIKPVLRNYLKISAHLFSFEGRDYFYTLNLFANVFMCTFRNGLNQGCKISMQSTGRMDKKKLSKNTVYTRSFNILLLLILLNKSGFGINCFHSIVLLRCVDRFLFLFFLL
jgi:hypothetical protein